MTWELNFSETAGDNSYLLFYCLFDASYLLLRFVGRTTSIPCYEWRENLIFRKVPEASYTSCFRIILIYLVHSSSFRHVRRKTNYLHLEQVDKSIFQKLPGIAEITGLMTISISAMHSASLRLVRCETSFLRDEWKENLILQKLPETTPTSCFTMLFYVLSIFWKFESCTTQDNFSTLRVTWDLNFKESSGDNLYLLICSNFDVLSTFCNFQPGTNKSEVSSL